MCVHSLPCVLGVLATVWSLFHSPNIHCLRLPFVFIRLLFMCFTRSKIHGWTWCPCVFSLFPLKSPTSPQSRDVAFFVNLLLFLPALSKPSWGTLLLEEMHCLSLEMACGLESWSLPVVYLSSSLTKPCQLKSCVFVLTPGSSLYFLFRFWTLLLGVLCWQFAGKHFSVSVHLNQWFPHGL